MTFKVAGGRGSDLMKDLFVKTEQVRKVGRSICGVRNLNSVLYLLEIQRDPFASV